MWLKKTEKQIGAVEIIVIMELMERVKLLKKMLPLLQTQINTTLLLPVLNVCVVLFYYYTALKNFVRLFKKIIKSIGSYDIKST